MKMIHRLLAATALVAAGLAASSANAEILTFDDVSVSSFQSIPGTYHGYIFNYFAFIGPNFSPSGYRNGVVSGANSACGCASDSGAAYSSISSASLFNLDSGFFTSAWNNNATLSITGLLNGATVYTASSLISVGGPTLLNLGFNGINEVRFAVSGGTSANLAGSGNYFAVDNLSLNAAAVPEPATWGMMILGFGLAGAAIRRRAKISRVTFAV